jgi:hypothetical protein
MPDDGGKAELAADDRPSFKMRAQVGDDGLYFR